ncbi:Os02g0279150, partial [Oryza sativa Japonica Group]
MVEGPSGEGDDAGEGVDDAVVGGEERLVAPRPVGELAADDPPHGGRELRAALAVQPRHQRHPRRVVRRRGDRAVLHGRQHRPHLLDQWL